VVDKLNPFKAPGANSIPNIVRKQCIDVLLPYMGPLYRVIFTLDIYPAEWRDSVMRVLRKMGKANYSTPDVYRS
jgi:hypothetical protein